MPVLEFKGQSIHFEQMPTSFEGGSDQPTVLFVHGIGANTEIWQRWREELGASYPMAAVDLPGHGKSSRPGAEFDWTFADLTALVQAVMAELGASRFLLVGESIGGTISLAAAAGRADVAGVVTCSTAHVGGSLQNIAVWRSQMAEGGMSGWSASMLERRFAPGQCDDAGVAWFDAAQQSSDGDAILVLADLLVGLDMSGQLSGIRCPVLLIHPDRSPFIPLAVAVDLKERLPNGELMVIPGARHGIALSHAREGATALQAFVGRHGIA